MMKLSSTFLALAICASAACGAVDFFGLPDKSVVPKSVAATPAPATPAPATPALPPPAIHPGQPALSPDGAYLKTPSVGGQNGAGQAFHDVGPNSGVLIGFQYTLGTNDEGGTVIESLTPIYVRAIGKVSGITRGTRNPDNPATVLEARPGYAVAGIDAWGGASLEAMRVIIMRYENGVLDPADSYRSKIIGNLGAHEGGDMKHLSTDTRPIVGIYGKASLAINELGLLIRKDNTAIAQPPPIAIVVPTDPPSHPRPPDLVKPTEPPVRPVGVQDTPPPGSVQIFACAQDQYTLFLNGREILTGADSSVVQSGIFPIVKGDVLAAVVQDIGGGKAWLSLRVVRDGTTILDAGDMPYQTTEQPSWKTSKLMSGFREPAVRTHYKRMGTDARPRAASAGTKDVSATTLYFKAVVP